MRVIRLPRLSRRVIVVTTVPVAAVLVVAAFVSPPVAGAAKPTAQPTATRTVTATVTQTVTQPPTTVTVTQPAQTVTVTAPPQTVTVTASPTSVPTTSSATTGSTTTATSTATTGPCPVAGANKPGAADPWGGCFPGPGNAGIPAGTTLTPYTGPNPITVANTKLDAISTDSRLVINAPGVTITRSRLGGGVTGQSGWPTVLDSFLQSRDYDRTVGGSLTVQRSEIKGGDDSSGGGWCASTGCMIVDNWIHNDTVLPANSTAHMSAWRQDQNTFLQHNVIACELQPSAADGGCSANLTGYGDFQSVHNNTMRRNLFVANPTGVSFCAYGGSSGEGGGKPYADQTHDIVFTENVFQRGINRQCGAYRAVGDYNPAKPGNIPGAGNGNDWTAAGNRYDDGVLMGPTDFGG